MEEKVVEQTNEKKPNLFLAILTAIGMGLIGAVLWGILYYFGYIAWIAAFVIMIAAGWAYKKFNLKLDIKGYIIITIITIIEIALALLISLNIAVMQAAGTGFFESFGLLSNLVAATPELSRAIIADSVLSLVFVVVGLVTFIIVEKKTSKQSQTQSASSRQKLQIEEQTKSTESTKVQEETTSQHKGDATNNGPQIENKEKKKD